MNTKKKIERCLRIAPKPPASGGLLDRLRQDFSATEIKARSSAIRKWFAPTDDSISLWRVAAAAAIVIAVMLPLSYGAVKVIKYFTVQLTFEYPEDNWGYSVGERLSAKGDTDIDTMEDVRRTYEEFRKLYKEGKAEEIEPGVWVVTLSNGEEFAYAGRNPESAGLLFADTENAKQRLEGLFDEIHELRKAGKYDRTFIKEVEKDGVKVVYYEDRFTLSNGRVVTMTTGEEQPAEDEEED